MVLKSRQSAPDAWAFEASDRKRDPWFNPYRFPASERAWAVVDEVYGDLMGHENRKRARRTRDRHAVQETVTVLVANLVHHHLGGGQGKGLPVPRAKKELGKHDRYQPLIFRRTFPRLLDQLAKRKYLRERRGEYSGLPSLSRRTTIRAGSKLVDLIEKHGLTFEDLRVSEDEEVIILKRSKRDSWDRGERIDYKDSDTTQRFRAELKAINAWLAQVDVRFDPFASDKPVDVTARRLFRYFTQASFDSGGRHFGGFWQFLRKDIRWKGLTIEGEPIVGLDYAQFNAILAYSIVEATPPAGDAYTLPGFDDHRDGVKKVFNVMLFDEGPRTKFPQDTNTLFAK